MIEIPTTKPEGYQYGWFSGQQVSAARRGMLHSDRTPITGAPAFKDPPAYRTMQKADGTEVKITVLTDVDKHSTNWDDIHFVGFVRDLPSG
jgi:hypothetical protein